MTHARPHLTTHSRGKGHSALAGVAYRLGLRLLDKRTGEWHDYRHRALGEEVVAAFTLAPEGAPMWATDPERLWSAVERAERRKDSQLAHDYRMPVPFGLSDAEATTMAHGMAQSIVERFHTIVSVGLHRDSPLDALGFPKPAGKIGLHAHVYFPTRRFEFKPEPVEDGDAQGKSGGSEGWAFTDKLKELSHKKAASVVIDQLNAQWADLANLHASAVGVVPDFTHLSYKRLGLAKLPQLRLGPSATAMERNGLSTRKGDSLRAALEAERMPPVDASTPLPTTAPMEVAPVVATSSQRRRRLGSTTGCIQPLRLCFTSVRRRFHRDPLWHPRAWRLAFLPNSTRSRSCRSQRPSNGNSLSAGFTASRVPCARWSVWPLACSTCASDASVMTAPARRLQ
jgi:hypothetical protein